MNQPDFIFSNRVGCLAFARNAHWEFARRCSSIGGNLGERSGQFALGSRGGFDAEPGGCPRLLCCQGSASVERIGLCQISFRYGFCVGSRALSFLHAVTFRGGKYMGGSSISFGNIRQANNDTSQIVFKIVFLDVIANDLGDISKILFYP
jgi:hypothetical protein